MSQLRVFRAFTVALVLCFSVFVSAEELKTVISHQRVKLKDILPDVAPGLADVDLGVAPPPGRSRYFSYEEMATRLRSRGISASRLDLPKGIRIESLVRQYSVDELSQMVKCNVEQALPSGFSLAQVSVTQDQLLSPSITMGRVHLPRFLLREGEQTQTGTIEIMWGRKVVMRMPVRMTVNVGKRVAGSLVERGTSVTLLIRRGHVEISALAQTLSSGKVGEVVSVRVGVTRKVMSARLVSPERAELEI